MARNRFFGLTSRVIMLITAGLLLLSYSSIMVNPATLWFISVIGICFVPLSIINAILLLWALKRHSKSFLIPLVALVPAFFFVGRYVQADSEEDRMTRIEEAGKTLKIISYNVGRFSIEGSGQPGRAAYADSVFNFLKSQDADIICLQEFHTDNIGKVKTYLQHKMPGYKFEYYLFPQGKSAFGNVTLSRLPIKKKGVIKFEESANLAIYTDYSYGGREFRIYNCHFESYNISMSGLVRSLTSKDRGEVITEAGNKMKKSITRRPKQVDQVFSDIENCSVESFVCGDFNDNPMSYTYYRMIRGRKDAFIEAGRGFGATFAGLWPVLRIDYVLFPRSCKAITHDIPRIPFSDHYPVVTEIEI